jgi:UDP-N-acetylmuramate dehydrogenase
MALGLGSNLIVRDGGVPGVVVRLGKAFAGREAGRSDAELRRRGLGILVSSTARDAGLPGWSSCAAIPARWAVLSA